MTLPYTITESSLGWRGDSGLGWGLSLVYNLPKSAHRHNILSSWQCTLPGIFRASCHKAAGHKGPPRPCMEHILLGLRTSQQGLIPRKDSIALALHRARQASTKIHTCVGSGAMEQRLENMVSFLGVRTETQYSSAQSD